MEVKASVEYLAGGGNRHPSCADWDSVTGSVCFGSGGNIALWRTNKDSYSGIIGFLHGHDGSVTALRYFRWQPDNAPLILSGSLDNTIRIWEPSTNVLEHFVCRQVLNDHTGSIHCLAVLPEASVFASGASDGSIKIWRVSRSGSGAVVELIQDLLISPKLLPLTLALSLVGGSDAIVLAVGGTRNVVQIYCSAHSTDHTAFKLNATLPGHESWIRSLDFRRESDSSSDTLLASASQDKYIRLWRIRRRPDKYMKANGIQVGSVESVELLTNKSHSIKTEENTYDITFEALLLGHEDWIYTVRWSSGPQKLNLLSASADNSLVVWEPDEASGIWISKTRLGEISAQKGSTTATGSAGGFWIGLWLENDDSVACLSRTGSWRRWRRGTEVDEWVQQLGISGHTGDVRHVAWSARGSYLLSASVDQTTRVHAPWEHGDSTSWHEYARPQIHGYDLNCIGSISDFQFVSGADEKLVRVFDTPRQFVQMLLGEQAAGKVRPDEANGASVPVLGLSNKASTVASEDLHELEQLSLTAGSQGPADLEVARNTIAEPPPLEDQLARHTLWPEREKLYGHGFEISCLAVSSSSGLIATACKASSLEHAVIRVYERNSWRALTPPLSAHSLTVTSMAFSDDDMYLISVGRDRQWTLFERKESEPSGFIRKFTSPKGHSRMILDCAWAPSKFGRVFGTAGRDKSCKIWSFDHEKFECNEDVGFQVAVTSIDICPRSESECMMALGTESGAIFIYVIDMETVKVTVRFQIDEKISPASAVSKLCWQPGHHGDQDIQREDVGERMHRLAVASQDHSVAIVRVNVN